MSHLYQFVFHRKIRYKKFFIWWLPDHSLSGLEQKQEHCCFTYQGLCMEKGFEKYSMLGGRVRIVFSLKLVLLLFSLKVRDLRRDFLSTCRRWCQQCLYYLYLISLGGLAQVAGQSRGLISYSDLFLEPCSLLRAQLAFMGNKLKERKLVLLYFSGWLFSNGLVKLSMAGGSHLWRHQKTDNLWSSCPKHYTGFHFRAQISNFRKFSFNSQQR